jgi:hypothetical protein
LDPLEIFVGEMQRLGHVARYAHLGVEYLHVGTTEIPAGSHQLHGEVGVDKEVHVNATRRSALRCGKPGHWSLGMPCQSAAEMVPKMALKLPSRRVVETRGQRHPMRPCELAQVASPRMLHLAVSFRQVRLRREKPDHIKGW